MLSVILETLCYESTDTLVKAYYEILLKTKTSRDNDSEDMLDLIFQNRVYSAGAVYHWDIAHSPVFGLTQRPGNSIATWIEKNQTKIENAIQATNDAYAKVINN